MGMWSRKPVHQSTTDSLEGPVQLHRHLGAFQLIMLGIGCIVGAGLFSITGIAAADNAGPGIILSFVISAIGCAFAGLCYSELAAMIPVAGSAYTFAYAALGEFIAWMIGWTLILEYAIGAAAVSISWSGYVVSLLEGIGVHLPPEVAASSWQLDGGSINIPALFIIAAVTGILMMGIRESAFINSIMVVIKLSVVVVFICLGAFYIKPENYTPFIPENTGSFGSFGWSGVLRASGVLFFAYIGFDAVSTASQEAVRPQRSVPIGILGSLAICTVIYILFSFVMVGLVHYSDLDVAAPVAVAINHTPYPWLQGLIKLAILTGLTSVMLVTLLGQSRIFYAMALDGLLPKAFSALHPKYRTPWFSNLIVMGFTGLIGAFVPIKVLGHITSIGTLLAFSIVCAGVLVLRYKEPDIHRPFKVPFVPYFPLMGIFVCGLMMFSLNLETWIRLLIWLILGASVYFLYGRRHSLQYDGS